MYKKKLWIKYIFKFGFRSVFFKNFFLIMFSITLPFICAIYILIYTNNVIRENEFRAYSDKIVGQISQDVNTVFKEVRERIVLILNDSNINLFLRTAKDAPKRYYDNDEIYELLKIMKNTVNYIDDIYVTSSYSQRVITSTANINYKDFYDLQCIQNIPTEANGFQIKYINREINGKTRQNISVCNVVGFDEEEKGIIIVNLDLKKMKKRFLYDAGISIKIMQDNLVLYSDDLTEIGKIDENYWKARGGEEEVLIEDLHEKSIELVVYIDKTYSGVAVQNVRMLTIIFTVLMCFLSVLLAAIISIKNLFPVFKILEIVDDFRIKFNEENLEDYKNEFYYIFESMKISMKKNDYYEEELKKRIFQLRSAQLEALQYQINPHFINNTLESINGITISSMGRGNEVSLMISDLAQLMRNVMESTSTIISIEEEIRYTSIYIRLNERRYKNRFYVVWKIPADLQRYKIIKLTLQPIVENAIYHGLKSYEKNMEIRIEAVKRGNDIQISVYNSGLGILPSKVEELNQSLDVNTISEINRKNIGLYNVNQRIKLAFGEEYGLKVESKINYGATVIITIPCQ